jgi:hypothetical protein
MTSRGEHRTLRALILCRQCRGRSRCRSTDRSPGEIDWAQSGRQSRAIAEYLAALEHEEPNPDRKSPKVISLSDPSLAWTAKANKRVQFGYGLNYLIDIENVASTLHSDAGRLERTLPGSPRGSCLHLRRTLLPHVGVLSPALRGRVPHVRPVRLPDAIREEDRRPADYTRLHL